jgi:phosphoribosylformylglycinamidine synthase PurS subunit
MPTYLVKLEVFPLAGEDDPTSKMKANSIKAVGFQGISDVRVSKLFELTLTAKDRRRATRELESMAQMLLANPVIEGFRILKMAATRTRQPAA